MSRETPDAIKAKATYHAFVAAREHVAACLAVVGAEKEFQRQVRGTRWDSAAVEHAWDERREAILRSAVTASTWRIADAAVQDIDAKEDSQ